MVRDKEDTPVVESEETNTHDLKVNFFVYGLHIFEADMSVWQLEGSGLLRAVEH